MSLVKISSITSILNESNVRILNESESEGYKLLEFNAPLGQCDVEGGNGIIYPCSVFKQAVETQFKPLVERGIAYGELDHPDLSACPKEGSQFCDRRQADVKLKNASHRFLKVWWEGNTLYGTIQLLPTPNGQLVYNILKIAKAPIGLSLRALGSVRQQNGKQIVTMMALRTFDIVAIPSYLVTVTNPFQESATNLINESLRELLKTTVECIDGKCLVTLSESENLGLEKIIELLIYDSISRHLEYIHNTLNYGHSTF